MKEEIVRIEHMRENLMLDIKIRAAFASRSTQVVIQSKFLRRLINCRDLKASLFHRPETCSVLRRPLPSFCIDEMQKVYSKILLIGVLADWAFRMMFHSRVGL